MGAGQAIDFIGQRADLGGDEMARGAFVGVAFATAFVGQGTPAFAGQDGWTVLAQAQTPGAGTESAPAQPQTGAPGEPTELPPVKVIQDQPKPPKKTVKPKPVTQQPVARQAAPVSVEEAEAAASGHGVPMSPVKGSEIPLEKVPAGVSIVSNGQIASYGSPALEGALQQYVPAAIISDVNGNMFSTDVQFRGYTASPVEGTPQGLAVYQNGVRINEVFGDTVNWELIPTSAIANMALVTGSPLYGLNALGGAINITMKDGFGFQGVESDTRAGSYGYRQESLQLGKQVDNFAAYLSVEGVSSDGWRYFSPADVARMYADLGVKDKNTELHINFTGAKSWLGVVGPAPSQLVAEDYSSVFTSPQTTDDQLAMLSINGTTKLTDTWSLSGDVYWRSFHQQHADGNISSTADCSTFGGSAGTLCFPTFASPGYGIVTSPQYPGGVPTAPFYGPNSTVGEIDYSTNDTNSFGGSLQATDKDKVFGLNNILIFGGSIDHGDVKNTSFAELGTLNTNNWVVTPNGIFPNGPDPDYSPVDLHTTTNYYSLFFTDTVDLTKALSVTAGGRYNYEELDLFDPNPLTQLTGGHQYNRFNPMAGLTYKFNDNISAYGGYAENNRAPTPAELGCSNPLAPCVLAEFLVSDPNLQQVVSKTWQGGFRGNFSPFGQGNLNWSVGYFRAENYNDILVGYSQVYGYGFFENAGNTLRQGVEANARYTLGALTLNASYAFVDATFLSNITIPSPDNPFADQNGNIQIHPGDHIPLIPEHRFKFSADYPLTERWKIGGDVVVTSSEYYVGDESNQNPQLPGYYVVNLRTSYEVTKNITLYGMINNLFNNKYATYAAFYPAGSTTVYGNPSPGTANLTSPDTITAAQPFSVYAGLKVKFPAGGPDDSFAGFGDGGYKDGQTYASVDWSGFYAGINGGGAWSDSVDQLAYAPDSFGGISPSGLFGGGQMGYNWQGMWHPRLVLGVEADIQGGGIGDQAIDPAGNLYKSELDYFGTVRGRAGYEVNNSLVYVTGGFAYGGVRNQANGINGNFPGGADYVKDTTATGYVVGAGVEFRLTPALSGKLEYQYIDLGKNDPFDIVSGTGTFSQNGGTVREDAYHTFRVGLNYYLTPGYGPLK